MNNNTTTEKVNAPVQKEFNICHEIPILRQMLARSAKAFPNDSEMWRELNSYLRSSQCKEFVYKHISKHYEIRTVLAAYYIALCEIGMPDNPELAYVKANQWLSSLESNRRLVVGQNWSVTEDYSFWCSRADECAIVVARNFQSFYSDQNKKDEMDFLDAKVKKYLPPKLRYEKLCKFLWSHDIAPHIDFDEDETDYEAIIRDYEATLVRASDNTWWRRRLQTAARRKLEDWLVSIGITGKK